MRHVLSILVVVSATWTTAAMANGGVKSPVVGSRVEGTAAKRLNYLEKGVLAVRGHMRHVTPKIVKILAEETKRILGKPGNKWITPSQLIGLAINESDLRWWLRLYTTPYQSQFRGVPPGADCGITQNRVSVYIPYWRRWLKECKRIAQLRKPRYSIRASFSWALRELNRIRSRWCCIRGDKRSTCRVRQVRKPGNEHFRCIMNVYNQGPRFAYVWRVRNCKPRQEVWENARHHKRRIFKCKLKNNYWLRTMCFAEGVRLGRKSRWSCRYAHSLAWIKRAYRLRRRK
jgi:hypothetical protein